MAIGLPAAAVWHFLWELSDTFTISTAEAGENSDQAASVQSVRTYGRLASYNAQTSRAILYISRHGTTHSLKVNTSLVEPFAAHNGSFYLFLGELEKLEEHRWCPTGVVGDCYPEPTNILPEPQATAKAEDLKKLSCKTFSFFNTLVFQ
uniref:CST complex subunit TEN1 isoform X1 n=1 Tax=Myxine glutinosa TaxID=7769 RepID=UPI00358FB096